MFVFRKEDDEEVNDIVIHTNFDIAVEFFSNVYTVELGEKEQEEIKAMILSYILKDFTNIIQFDS